MAGPFVPRPGEGDNLPNQNDLQSRGTPDVLNPLTQQDPKQSLADIRSLQNLQNTGVEVALSNVRIVDGGHHGNDNSQGIKQEARHVADQLQKAISLCKTDPEGCRREINIAMKGLSKYIKDHHLTDAQKRQLQNSLQNDLEPIISRNMNNLPLRMRDGRETTIGQLNLSAEEKHKFIQVNEHNIGVYLGGMLPIRPNGPYGPRRVNPVTPSDTDGEHPGDQRHPRPGYDPDGHPKDDIAIDWDKVKKVAEYAVIGLAIAGAIAIVCTQPESAPLVVPAIGKLCGAY